LASASDGLSNTIMTGEGCGGTHKTSSYYGPWGLYGTHTCCHGRVYSGGGNPIMFSNASRVLYGKNYMLNHDWVTWTRTYYDKSYAWVFNSLHPGGAQFCMGDGSVKFIQDTIDMYTWVKLNYAHDGQQADLDF
jgi:prepilin-type processing-associated H-X9-DG protein